MTRLTLPQTVETEEALTTKNFKEYRRGIFRATVHALKNPWNKPDSHYWYVNCYRGTTNWTSQRFREHEKDIACAYAQDFVDGKIAGLF